MGESRTSPPALTLVMPCYNEEAIVRYTIERLFSAFDAAGHELQIVAVDNGSTDRTGDILAELARRMPGLTVVRVEINQGYGFGVLSGLPACKAPLVGFIPADGEVDAEDVVRLYEAVASSPTPVVGKVRRRFRMDGLKRKLVSTTYNLFVRLLWPGLRSLDMNGNPKILPRSLIERMKLRSTGWLLDAEILVKAHYMGVRVLEFNAFARMRSGGTSHVRPSAVWEFVRTLLVFRFSRGWRRDFASAAEREARAGGAPVMTAGGEADYSVSKK
ncbi:MAG: glycosyltransferase family 2 protein [Candidatus Dadabacteria bacterium]|nr:MAG: glycosyltransferase family 2 protein [Candidatus Dadabacteria bacterium]